MMNKYQRTYTRKRLERWGCLPSVKAPERKVLMPATKQDQLKEVHSILNRMIDNTNTMMQTINR